MEGIANPCLQMNRTISKRLVAPFVAMKVGYICRALSEVWWLFLSAEFLIPFIEERSFELFPGIKGTKGICLEVSFFVLLTMNLCAPNGKQDEPSVW